MILFDQNAAQESTIRLQLSNGWSVSILPHQDGKASLTAWRSHDPNPAFGVLKVVSGGEQDGDGIAAFIAHIADEPAAPWKAWSMGAAT